MSSHEVKSYINGEWMAGVGEKVVNGNPAHPSQEASWFRVTSTDDIETALAGGFASARSWQTTPAHARAEILRRTADLLEERSETIAQAISNEQGKIITVSRGEVARAASIFRYFAHEADRATGQMYASPRPGERIFTDRVAIGQVLCITPWNVPLALPAWKIAPALAHGNSVLWKPSQVTPLVASHLVNALIDAGLPVSVLNLVLARSDQAESALRDSRVVACTFTGSTSVGRHLMAVGADVGKAVLAEMGGKNAAIVLADADLDWAAEQIAGAAMGWSGQRCTATSRIIVDRSVVDKFTQNFMAKVNALVTGDPLDGTSDLGPVSSRQQFETISELVSIGTAQGARVLAGGVPDGDGRDGYFVAPTVIDQVDIDNILFTDEVFGPVAVIVAADSPDQALELANDGDYGLSGSVFTSDLDSALRFSERLDVGVLHINSESTGADPHVPFGGFGASGTDHKEMGEEARDFYTKLRTVYLRGGR